MLHRFSGSLGPLNSCATMRTKYIVASSLLIIAGCSRTELLGKWGAVKSRPNCGYEKGASREELSGELGDVERCIAGAHAAGLEARKVEQRGDQLEQRRALSCARRTRLCCALGSGCSQSANASSSGPSISVNEFQFPAPLYPISPGPRSPTDTSTHETCCENSPRRLAG